MFSPRSIPPWSPPLDRLVIRAALAKGATWPRTPQALAELVATSVSRSGETASWAPDPEVALMDAVQARVGLDATIAAPAWGRSSFAAPLDRWTRQVWIEPALHHLDPGLAEVTAALDAGADVVLLAPLAGDCGSLLGIADLCARRGAIFALDARASSGGRVLDGPPGGLGDLTLVAVDGEPGPAPCPGAILLGADRAVRGSGVVVPGLALRLLRDSLRMEPRLRRLIRPPGEDRTPAPDDGSAPSWAYAAAAARLQQSGTRASQRARHARVLRSSISWIEGVDLPDEPTGVQSAGGSIGLLMQHRDGVLARLTRAGVGVTVGGAWLAPAGARTTRAEAVAAQALLLPLLPFFRPKDLDFMGEALRRAALKASAPED